MYGGGRGLWNNEMLSPPGSRTLALYGDLQTVQTRTPLLLRTTQTWFRGENATRHCYKH